MTSGRPPITRADLAKALETLVHDDARLAGALAMCEAWEPGYVATAIVRAEVLVANDPDDADDDTPASAQARSILAVRRAIEALDPRGRVERAGAVPPNEAVKAFIQMLESRAFFHETTGDLERRGVRREPLSP